MKKITIRFSDEEYSHLDKMLKMAEDVELLLDEVIDKSDLENFLRSIIRRYIPYKRHQLKKPSDLPIKNKLGEILNNQQIEKYDFAKIVGITPSTISLICDQKIEPSLDVAIRISDALGLHIYHIFYRE